MAIPARCVRWAWLWCFLCFPVVSRAAESAIERWVSVANDEVIVLTDGAEGPAVNLAGEFSEFRRQFGHAVLGRAPAALPPTVILLFRSDRSFKRYKAAGTGNRYAGVFARFDDRSLVALSDEHQGPERRAIAFHEGVHWLLDEYGCTPPLWLNEGLAEVFSTFEIESGRYVVGRPIAAHVRRLREETPWALERLFAIDARSPDYVREHSVGIFYAQSWALTHLLLFGEGRGVYRRDREARDLLLQGDAAAAERLVLERLGGSPETALMQLRDYVESGRCVPVSGSLWSKPGGDLVVAPAEPGQVELALGMLLAGTNRLGDALRQFRLAEQVRPQDPRPHEGYALVATRRRQSGDAARHYRRAVELGSTNPFAHLAVAQEALRNRAPSQASPGGEPRAAEWAQAFRRVVFRPGSPAEWWVGFAHALYLAPELARVDVGLVESAAKRWPDNAELLYGLAMLHWRLGDTAEAIAQWEAVLKHPAASAELRSLSRAAWNQQAATNALERARALLEAGSLAEVEPVLDAVPAERVPATMTEAFIDVRRETRNRQALHEAQMALANSEFTAARERLNALLASPGIGTAARDEANRLLGRVDRAERERGYVDRYNLAVEEIRARNFEAGVDNIERLLGDPEVPGWLRQRASDVRQQIRTQTGR